MKTFIEGVRKEPCLWNPLHPDYREMHIKEWAWQRVVKHYNNSSIPNVVKRENQSHNGMWSPPLKDIYKTSAFRSSLPANKKAINSLLTVSNKTNHIKNISNQGKPKNLPSRHAFEMRMRSQNIAVKSWSLNPAMDAIVLIVDQNSQQNNRPRSLTYIQEPITEQNLNVVFTVQVAKIEWKKLRDNHRDALKRAKLGKNKLLPAQITTWKYAKAMQFLEPHMKYRITEHIEMEPPAATIQKNTDQDVSTTDTVDIQTENSSPSHKRRCLDRNSDFRQDKDALESFFNCILQSTRTMPHWMQTQVKKKIFAVIIEAEECLSSQDMAPMESKDNILPIETEIKSEVYSDDTCDNE